MRLIYFLPILLNAPTLSAQVLQVDSLQELPLEMTVEKAELAPSGTFVLLSDYNYKGLTTVDLQTKRKTTITNADGAGYRSKALKNGDIVYREVYNLPQRSTTIKRYIAAQGVSSTIVAPTEENVQVSSVVDTNQVATNNDFQLELTLGSQKRTLSPLGTDQRYIWPSISPDGKQILFYVSGKGAYVCNLNGEEVVSLGILRAPKWYGNTVVIGQRDKDNGVIVLSSEIIAKDIASGAEQRLTTEELVAMYPSVSDKGDKILFSTPEGKAYIIYIHAK